MNGLRLPIFSLASLLVFVVALSALADEVDPAKAKPSDDGSVLWFNCQDIGVEGKGWAETPSFYFRLPTKVRTAAPPKDWGLSVDTAGMCVRFWTDSPSLKVRWTLSSADLAMPHMPATGVSGVDVYAKDKTGRWSFVHNGRPHAKSNETSCALPPAEQYLVYLPLYNGVESIELGIPKEKKLRVEDAATRSHRKSIVFYGGSITQGGCASRPGMAYTAIAGRRLDATIINLGFSGSGVMEPVMGDLLAELNPSIYVLDTLGNMSVEQVKERVEPFVATLRKAHPDTPILLVEEASVKNISPTDRGRALHDICDKLTASGVKQIYFLPNKGMLGDDGEGTVDGSHPSDLGMMRHADIFTDALRPLIHRNR